MSLLLIIYFQYHVHTLVNLKKGFPKKTLVPTTILDVLYIWLPVFLNLYTLGLYLPSSIVGEYKDMTQIIPQILSISVILHLLYLLCYYFMVMSKPYHYQSYGHLICGQYSTPGVYNLGYRSIRIRLGEYYSIICFPPWLSSFFGCKWKMLSNVTLISLT